MSAIVCAICAEYAEEVGSGGEFEELECPRCGHYCVSQKLLADMINAKQNFHTSRTQQYLATCAKTGGVPRITVAQASFYNLIITK